MPNERTSMRYTVWSPGPKERAPDDETSELSKMEAAVAPCALDDMIREADAVLDVLAARGILHVLFEQGRLAYFYDCSREHAVMETDGYTAAVQAFLKKPFDLGAMMTISKDFACEVENMDWALEVLGLQDDPVWKFLKAKALQVVEFESTR